MESKTESVALLLPEKHLGQCNCKDIPLQGKLKRILVYNKKVYKGLKIFFVTLVICFYFLIAAKTAECKYVAELSALAKTTIIATRRSQNGVSIMLTCCWLRTLMHQLLLISIYVNCLYSSNEDGENYAQAANTRKATTNQKSSTTDLLGSENETASPALASITPEKRFLLWTKNCQIPDLDPFASALRFDFDKPVLPECSENPPLTDIKYDKRNNRMILNFYKSRLKNYANEGPLNCSFMEIKRSGTDKSADSEFKLIDNNYFNDSVVLSSSIDAIIVFCTNSKSSRTVAYSNVHPLVQKKQFIVKRLEKWENRKRPFNVILFGIDSISRINLKRTMPMTEKHVRDTGWFDLAGYNKIGDNTFPNLMAILTGYNETSYREKCNPESVGRLDACPFIWKGYRKAGYVTAYAEDSQPMSTFNYCKVGFQDPPTDYYLRPTMLAAEKHLEHKDFYGLAACNGPNLYIKTIYDYALQLRETYSKGPYFGIFWTNSLSHNYFFTSSTMDEIILEYLKAFNSTGILNDTIVFFLSDHGMRWGELRKSPTGYLEERLPFFKIWLPTDFQRTYPQFAEGLRINQHRLTTPFDFHVTLKHILQLTEYEIGHLQAQGCPNCQSLLVPISENRSCETVAIEDHWCTCRTFHPVDVVTEKMTKIVQLIIDYINELVKNVGVESKLCSHLVLDKIRYVNQEAIPNEFDNSTLEGYQLSFVTNPGGAEFETTVRYDTFYGNFTVTGKISRLNSYNEMSKCVHVEALKMFCACKNSSVKNSSTDP